MIRRQTTNNSEHFTVPLATQTADITVHAAILKKAVERE